ncbi:MAG: TenA family protein, partial [Propionibacteriaceae bacterium]
MTFTDDAWAATATIREAISSQPFVTALGDGTLSLERFTYYMAQDALYLVEYSRALAQLAAKATTPEAAVFWAESSRNAIIAERELHAGRLGELDAGAMAPTCQAYTSYLLGLAGTAPYAVTAAGVLPCFWIYQAVGEELLAHAGGLQQHPYGDWIGVYGDEAFTASVEQAKDV